MNKLLVFAFVFFVSIPSFAQFTLSGTVYDTVQNPLSFATVVVLESLDSSMHAFGMSNEDGLFQIDIEEAGNYTLQFSYIGYESTYLPLQNDWKSKKITIPPVQLKRASVEIREVTVETERIPMGIKGDTIVYDAKAFSTREGATVEDLLKNLPGIQVDRDGNIKAQGEEVRKVLVDGKEFFGNDPKIATKNLEAEAIDKVEVFDKKSETAEFTGIDDGQEEKTLNLKLKEGYKNGGFGKAEVKGGTRETYYGKLNYNMFNSSSQLSFIGNSNNINEQAFSFQDYLDFMGGIGNISSLNSEMMSGISPGGNNSQKGINTNYSLGSNFNHGFNEQLTLSANYFYLDNKNDLRNRILSSNFNPTDRFESNEFTLREQRDKTHRLNTKLKWKKNPFTEIIFYNDFRGVINQIRNNSTTNFTTYNNTVGETYNSLKSNDEQFSWDSRVLLKRKFGEKGRSWISNAEYQRMKAFQTHHVDNNAFGEDLFQFQDFQTSVERHQLSTSYTEPLKKKWYAILKYELKRHRSRPERNFFDLVEGKRELNDSLSSNFNRLLWEHSGSLSIRKNSKKLKAIAGLTTSVFQLKTIGSFRNFTYLLPTTSLDFNLKGSQHLKLNYNTSINVPSLSQLITIPNNVDPNRKYVGNSSLLPEYKHSLSLAYNYFDSFNFTSVFLNLRVEKVKDKIVNQTIVNPDFTLTETPVNTDLYEALSGFLGLYQPIKPLRINYHIDANSRWSNYNSWLNGQATRVKELNYFADLGIERKNKEKWDFQLGIVLSWTRRTYAINADFDQNFANYDYYLDLDWKPKEDLLFRARYSLRRYNDVFFSRARRLHFVNASVRKSFKNDKWAIELLAKDILNETIGLSRSGTDNSLREERFNTLAQYFMLGLSYKLRKKGPAS
jgi:hypothetical protein